MDVMTKQVYYADKVIIFTSDYQTSEGKTLFVPEGRDVNIHRVLKALDDTRSLTVWSPDVKTIFDRFCRQFTRVDAAGGAVVATDGRILMIRRRGFWDLPKGHREQGEEVQDCALREVAEECGIDPSLVTVGSEITRTLHFYWDAGQGRWEMKLTVWYRMSYAGDPRHVTPQTEEDITDIEWFEPEQAACNAALSYKTIREVIDKLKN